MFESILRYLNFEANICVSANLSTVWDCWDLVWNSSGCSWVLFLWRSIWKKVLKSTTLNISTLPTVWWHNNFENWVHHQCKCVCKCHLHINIHLFHRSAVRCRWCAAIKGRRIHRDVLCATPNMDMLLNRKDFLAAQSHFQTHFCH